MKFNPFSIEKRLHEFGFRNIRSDENGLDLFRVFAARQATILARIPD